MKTFAIILVMIAAATFGTAQAQSPTTAPTTGTQAVSPTNQGLSTPVTSTTTNCMMTCNSQASNCRTGCVVPAPAVALPSPSASQASILNASAGGTCIAACSSNQLTCQQGCALQSPSR